MDPTAIKQIVCFITIIYLISYTIVATYIPLDNSTLIAQFKNLFRVPFDLGYVVKAYSLTRQLGIKKEDYKLGIKAIFCILKREDVLTTEQLTKAISWTIKNPIKNNNVEFLLSMLIDENDIVHGYETVLRYEKNPEYSVAIRSKSKGLSVVKAIIAWNKFFGDKSSNLLLKETKNH